MAAQAADLSHIQAEFEQLRHSFDTVQLATAGAEGQPEASYAPYVEHEGDFYVYVSELSAHTGNLLQNARASALFIESEAGAAHLFARRRLTYRCQVSEIPRVSAHFEAVLDQFAAKFGGLIDNLRTLQDFHLFRLEPQSAVYVAGFAQAYAIEDAKHPLVRHIRDRGHRRRDDTAAVGE
jgi:putative heme iron utilization protein